MTRGFTKLLEPGQIGPVRTPNRMLKTANGTSYMEDDQTCGPRMVAYYERLARGGIGFLVVESCGVEYPLGIQHVHYSADGGLIGGVQLHFDDDKYIPGFSRLTEAVHKHDCPVSIQFQHAGPWNPTGLLPRDSKVRDVKCASAMTEEELPGPDFMPCRAMTKAGGRRPDRSLGRRGRTGVQGGFRCLRDQPWDLSPGGYLSLTDMEQTRRRIRGPELREPNTVSAPDHPGGQASHGTNFAVHWLFNIVEYNHPLATTLEEGANWPSCWPK